MKVLIPVLLALFVFIWFAEGVLLNPFAIWNAAPLVICPVLYARAVARSDRRQVWGALGFLLGSMAISMSFHIAWLLNLDEIRTGSSTSALVLLFIPIYACVAGGAGFAFGWLARHAGWGNGA